jgi:hypothetical protein
VTTDEWGCVGAVSVCGRGGGGASATARGGRTVSSRLPLAGQ